MTVVEIKLKKHGANAVAGYFPKEYFNDGDVIFIDSEGCRTHPANSPNNNPSESTPKKGPLDEEITVRTIRTEIKSAISDFVTHELDDIISERFQKKIWEHEKLKKLEG